MKKIVPFILSLALLALPLQADDHKEKERLEKINAGIKEIEEKIEELESKL